MDRGKEVASTSGARHVRQRRCTASARRVGDTSRSATEEPNADWVPHSPLIHTPGYEEPEEEFDDDFDDADYYALDADLQRSPPLPTHTAHVLRGADSRFAPSSTASSRAPGSSSRRRSSTSTDTSWIVTQPMPGGPIDGSVIPSFGGHVAARIWNGESRTVLRGHGRVRDVARLREWYHGMTPEVRDIVDGTPFGHLVETTFTVFDMPLISAFVERWQPDTNTFHMPFGEMSIMLHDVDSILGLSVEGRIVGDCGTIDQQKIEAAILFGLDLPSFIGLHYRSGGILVESIMTRFGDYDIPATAQVTGFLLMLLGTILFPDKSGNRVRPSFLPFLQDLDDLHSYSWGTATLAVLYRQLGIASRARTTQICGCLTLIQAWIYEYFPCFRPSSVRRNASVGIPRSQIWEPVVGRRGDEELLTYRRLLDDLTAAEVDWKPYGLYPIGRVPRTVYFGCIRGFEFIELYQPDRSLRQLGFVQIVPADVRTPIGGCHRPADPEKYKVEWSAAGQRNEWMTYPTTGFLNIPSYTLAIDTFAATPEYHQWFLTHSHPYLQNEPEHDVTHQLSQHRSAELSSRTYGQDGTLFIFRKYLTHISQIVFSVL